MVAKGRADGEEKKKHCQKNPQWIKMEHRQIYKSQENDAWKNKCQQRERNYEERSSGTEK